MFCEALIHRALCPTSAGPDERPSDPELIGHDERTEAETDLPDLLLAVNNPKITRKHGESIVDFTKLTVSPLLLYQENTAHINSSANQI